MSNHTDSEVLRQAGVLLAAHRDRAPAEADRIAGSLAARQDIDGYANWVQVRLATEALLREPEARVSPGRA